TQWGQWQPASWRQGRGWCAWRISARNAECAMRWSQVRGGSWVDVAGDGPVVPPAPTSILKLLESPGCPGLSGAGRAVWTRPPVAMGAWSELRVHVQFQAVVAGIAAHLGAVV